MMLNSSYINIITHAGGSGYFLSGLIYKYALKHSGIEFENTPNMFNEYTYSNTNPIVRRYHYDLYNNDFAELERVTSLKDFIKNSTNIFLTCYDENTSKFTWYCAIIKHTQGTPIASYEEIDNYELDRYVPIKNLAVEMIDYNSDINAVFDYKKLIIDADIKEIERFCFLTKLCRYKEQIINDIKEYHKRNLDLLELVKRKT